MFVSGSQCKIYGITQTANYNMNFACINPTTFSDMLICFVIYSPFLAPAGFDADNLFIIKDGAKDADISEAFVTE